MEISDFLSEGMIIAELEADNKRQMLEKLSEFAAKLYSLDKNAIFEAIWERENLGSTGYGNGVAFPHARMENMEKVITVFARLHNAIDYDTLDGKPVDIVAFIISPENSGNDHLQTLAAFSRILKNDAKCNKIRQAHSAHEILMLLE